MIRSTVELTEIWSALTGEPLKATRQRVRVLRLAGLLPDARVTREPITDKQIAALIIATLGSETQAGTPETVLQYSALRPFYCDTLTPLKELALGDAIAELLRQVREDDPWRPFPEIQISSSRREAKLVLFDPEGKPLRVYYLEGVADGEVPPRPPINVLHTLSPDVFAALAHGQKATPPFPHSPPAHPAP